MIEESVTHLDLLVQIFDEKLEPYSGRKPPIKKAKTA